MDNGTNRLYGDLAWLWPLWGDPETEYARYCQWLAAQLRRRAQRELRTLLDAGCGGGKNIFNLRRQFQVTGLDRSERMLALAAELNPGCELIQADLRSFDLGCQFDAVFLDDAVSYLLTEADVAGALRQFRKHLAPGGVLGFSLDATTESFQNNRTQVFQSVPSAKHPDTEVTYITHAYLRPDGCIDATFIYLIRRQGKLSIETDRHVLGLFSLAVWQDLLRQAGFAADLATYEDDREQYPSFFCVKE